MIANMLEGMEHEEAARLAPSLPSLPSPTPLQMRLRLSAPPISPAPPPLRGFEKQSALDPSQWFG